MKAPHLIATLILTITILGCTDSELRSPEQDELQNGLPEFSASTCPDETKTFLDEYKVKWSNEDLVAICAGTNYVIDYKVKEGYAGGSSTILTPLRPNREEAVPINANVAFYPFEDVLSINSTGEKYIVKANIPARQTYSYNSFGKGSMPMIAVSSSVKDTKLSFKNLYGVLKLSVKMEDVIVKSVEVKGNAGELLSGESIITCSHEMDPEVVFSEGSSSGCVTLDCGEGIKLNSSTPVQFYIPLPPIVFSKGITVKFHLSTGEEIVRTVNREVTVKRSKILSLPEVVDDSLDDNYIDLTYDVNTVSEDTFLWDDSWFPDTSPFWSKDKYGDLRPLKITKVVYDGKEEAVNSYRIIPRHRFDRTGELLIRIYYDGVLNTIKSIKSATGAFPKECRLRGIVIPKTVTSWGLKDLPVLSSVSLEGGGKWDWVQIENCPSLERFVGPSASEDERCLISDSGELKAFAPYGIASYSVPEGITSIATQVFYEMQDLVSISLPTSLKTIGDEAFRFCSSLRSVSMPVALKSVGNYAFAATGLESVEVPDGCVIGKGVFEHCGQLAKASISGSLTSIPEYTFSECKSLKEVVLPDGYSSIKNRAFSGCRLLESFVLPSSVTYIGDYAFLGTGIKSIKIPKSVAYLGESAFWGAPLEELSFEDGCTITRLEEDTFGATKISSVTIPSSVSSIRGGAFKDCCNLISVSFQANSILRECSDGAGAFKGCTALNKVELPSTTEILGAYTFQDCISLKEIVLPVSLKKIGISAFQNTGLTKIKIPDSVTSIDKMAFYECKNLTEIRIGSGLTSLQQNSFMGYHELKRIESTSTSYVSGDDNMFLMSKEGEVMLFASGCTLESYSFPETIKGFTLKKIGPKLLFYSQTIKTVDLPSTLEVVDCHAFKCNQISTIRSRSVTPAQLMWSDPVFMGGMMVGKSTDPFPDDCTFYVPAESIDAYKPVWDKHNTRTFLPL